MARWLPLESNPDVINKYFSAIGVPDSCKCVDVYGFDKEMLETLPKPVLALLLLFPITDKYEEVSKQQTESLKGQPVADKVYFIHQHIGNACGTVALIHALANNEERIKFDENGFFKKFLEKTRGCKPEERSKLLEADADMTRVHETSAEQGQTAAPPRDEKVNLHFVCFIDHNGTLYELDGRKPVPVAHGSTKATSFLDDAAAVCKQFMDREPGNLQFTAMAVCGAE